MPKVIDHSPSPKSHIKTLMRIGYTLNSAVADVIDNSITAGAGSIEVYAPPGLDEPVISIIDNGCGMDLD
uniref:ATP-binding protein n=1 Tax=Acinetobacter baumannii TaxID=470 RepID=UPI00232D965C